MADAILDYITKYQGVSFAELERNIKGFAGGDIEWSLPKTNIVLWQGLTEEAVNALNLLRTGKHIHPNPCPVMIYLMDGLIPRLPVAKTARPYKEPHWLPCVFNPGPTPDRPPARRIRLPKEPTAKA